MFQAQCVSGSWELRLRTGDSRGAGGASQEGGKQSIQTRVCLLSLLGMGVDSEETSLQKICCRARDETGGLDLEEQKERWRSTVGRPASLAEVCGLA